MEELYSFVQECAKILAMDVQKFTVLSLNVMLYPVNLN